jgi:hypothetical protein
MDRFATQQKCPLSRIIQHERRENDEEPADPDRPGSKMSEVGIQRLAPGQRQKYGPDEKQDGLDIEHLQEPDGAERIEDHRDDFRMAQDLGESEPGDGRKPQEHDRPVDFSYHPGTFFLESENDRQDSQGYRYDQMSEIRRRHLESFHRRKHGNRRGDNALAEQQSRREHEQKRNGDDAFSGTVLQQSEQRERPSLPLVIRLQHQNGIFDSHENHEQPKNKARGTGDMLRRHGQLPAPEKDLVEGIERRSPDIAVHDTEGPEYEGSDGYFVFHGRKFGTTTGMAMEKNHGFDRC